MARGFAALYDEDYQAPSQLATAIWKPVVSSSKLGEHILPCADDRAVSFKSNPGTIDDRGFNSRNSNERGNEIGLDCIRPNHKAASDVVEVADGLPASHYSSAQTQNLTLDDSGPSVGNDLVEFELRTEWMGTSPAFTHQYVEIQVNVRYTLLYFKLVDAGLIIP